MNYQPLFNHLLHKHNLGLDDSTLEEIRKICIQISLPDNPMEIQEYNDLWSDPKSDRDMVFREGLEKGYEIAKEVSK